MPENMSKLTNDGSGHVRSANTEVKLNDGTGVVILFRDKDTVNSGWISGVGDEEAVADIAKWTWEGGAVESVSFPDH